MAVELELFGFAFDECARFAESVEAIEPLLIFPGEIDGAFECVCPFKMLKFWVLVTFLYLDW